jgi:hypothetical protein
MGLSFLELEKYVSLEAEVRDQCAHRILEHTCLGHDNSEEIPANSGSEELKAPQHQQRLSKNAGPDEN